MSTEHAHLAFAEHLDLYLRANFPLVVIDSVEEQWVVAKAATDAFDVISRLHAMSRGP